MTETEYRDWTVTLPFNVPAGDTDGVLTEALLDAAIEQAPDESTGFVARADTEVGRVWITFTQVSASEAFVADMLKQMQRRVFKAVLSGEDACISAA